MKVYTPNGNGNNKEDDENGNDTTLLRKLYIGQKLNLIDIKAIEKFTSPPPRYTEASLVRKLEELGIGRPSTYAPTISTIQKRGYIVKESRPGKDRQYTELILKDGVITEEKKTQTYNTEKKKLFPTNTAMIVNDFLVKHFQDVVDYSFTATVEKEFDDIAQGKKVWHDVLKEFYDEFHNNVKKTDDLPRETKETTRKLGVDPKTGEPVYVRLGKYGAFAQIGDSDENKKPRFAPLKKDQYIENITLEEALDLFKLPRVVGEFEGEPMTVRIGRFGPFIAHKDKFYSLGKDNDPYTIEADKAIEIILAKRKRDAEKTIKLFEENPKVKILKGRWGPYIAVGRKFYKIPKDIEPESLTLEQCLKLIDEQEKEKTVKETMKKVKKAKKKK
jgi:DNA topoisomerase-1